MTFLIYPMVTTLWKCKCNSEIFQKKVFVQKKSERIYIFDTILIFFFTLVFQCIKPKKYAYINKKEVTTFKYKIQKSVPTVSYFIQFFKNKQPEGICFMEVCIISNLKHLNLKFGDCNDSISETLGDLQARDCSCPFTWLRSLLGLASCQALRFHWQEEIRHG